MINKLTLDRSVFAVPGGPVKSPEKISILGILDEKEANNFQCILKRLRETKSLATNKKKFELESVSLSLIFLIVIPYIYKKFDSQNLF